MFFPEYRARRLRRNENIRRMVRETHLRVEDLIYPMFSAFGRGIRKEIPSMPGIFQQSIEHIVTEAKEVHALGIPAVILFGIPEHKDPMGEDAYSDTGIIQETIRAIKEEVPELTVITDVCLCEYTDHGHCGPLVDGDVDNDAAVAGYVRQALVHAEAGADLLAPSGMMDGQVGAIRTGLDDSGYAATGIVAYAAKFASGYYGPFRDAAESTPAFGDRRTYQEPPANRREAVREVALDAAEGADAVMVKPALPYLDVLSDVRRSTQLPLAAYHVSGEYAAVLAAGERGWLDADRVLLESVLSIRRAGADLVLTYAAETVVRQLD
jgi:porphobilinogen synthase